LDAIFIGAPEVVEPVGINTVINVLLSSFIVAGSVRAPCFESNSKIICNTLGFIIALAATLGAVIGKPLPLALLVAAGSVPLLALVSAAVVPAVFNPAGGVTVDVALGIALLELAFAVVPAAAILSLEGVFDLHID